MRVLITGGTGLIGKGMEETRPEGDELLVLHRHPPGLTAHPTKEIYADVRDGDSLDKDFCGQDFEVVIHAAGLSSVDYVERHYEEAMASNVTGTSNVVEMCNRYGKHLVYVSSNAVFDGEQAPYHEEDPTLPVNAYGRIKAQCEELVAKSATSYTIVRPILMYGWPYQSGRQNPVTWLLEKLGRREEAYVVTDVYENPLFYLQAGVALWKVVHRPDIDFIHLAGGEIVNRYQLALAVAEEFGLDAGLIHPVNSDFFPDLARRPRNTSFVTSRMEKELGVTPIKLAEGLRVMAGLRQLSSAR